MSLWSLHFFKIYGSAWEPCWLKFRVEFSQYEYNEAFVHFLKKELLPFHLPLPYECEKRDTTDFIYRKKTLVFK